MSATRHATLHVTLLDQGDNFVMNIIETTAPISIEDLKKHFTDKSSHYLINYQQSQLHGKKLLIYISNLDISCDIDLNGVSRDLVKELFSEYLRFEMVTTVSILELIMIEVIKHRKQIVNNPDLELFVEGNEEMIDKWISKLDSLTLYNMLIVNSEYFRSFVESFPINETTSVEGINFVSLLKHEDFYSTYQIIDQSHLQYYKNYFDNYMFKGNNLYGYWATEKNPMFMLTYGISEDVINNDEYLKAKADDIQELKNASLI
jgi:hypothetical protein